MTLTRRLLLLGSSCLAMVAGLPRGAAAGATTITFVLVNDIYLMNEETGPDGRKRGGFPRLAAVVKAERDRAAQSGRRVIFAHAGDTLSPSLMSGIDQGYHIVDLINMIAPDIFVPGNHEFDFGPEVFLRRMGEAKFPLFACNMRKADGSTFAGFKDRAILDIGGIKVGFTGAALTETPRLSNAGDVKFAPLVPSVEQQVQTLRAEGAEFVVAVVHAGRGDDLLMLANQSADLILTGHDHDLFIDYDGRCAIVESSHDAKAVTMIDVTLTPPSQPGRPAIWMPNFRVVDTADVEPDPQVLAAVQAYESQLSREFDVPVATTAIELDSRNAAMRLGEAAIGNLYADALRESTHSDIALTNGGGLRGNKIYAAGGPITRRDVLAELPFGNKISILLVTGRDIRAAIENGLGRLPEASGRFPQVSGMTVEANMTRPSGRRVIAIKVGGAPLDERKTYRLATNDFLARGGDDYTMLRDAKRVMPDKDGPLMANEVMAYLRTLGTVRKGTEGRIVLK
jgi:2',3'-cyclic-nucleotide 2'-phosphodiesterase (5'-nucleotidase family)